MTLSDRELDARVAEKVMGWTDVRPIIGRRDERGQIHNEFVPHATMPDGQRIVLPNFSASIADAWTVVEKMAERRTEVCLTYTDDRRATVIFALMEPVGIAEDDTIARAICLAALRAVGEDV